MKCPRCKLPMKEVVNLEWICNPCSFHFNKCDQSKLLFLNGYAISVYAGHTSIYKNTMLILDLDRELPMDIDSEKLKLYLTFS
jgi:hypothetical protein